MFLAVFLVVYYLYDFFSGYPTADDVKKRVESILTSPRQCDDKNPGIVPLIEKIGFNYKYMRIREKFNAMPKRMDYFVEDVNGEVLAELIYRVDGGCLGLRVVLVPNAVTRQISPPGRSD